MPERCLVSAYLYGAAFLSEVTREYDLRDTLGAVVAVVIAANAAVITGAAMHADLQQVAGLVQS